MIKFIWNKNVKKRVRIAIYGWQLSPIRMDRSIMTTLSFPKILSAVTTISNLGAVAKSFWKRHSRVSVWNFINVYIVPNIPVQQGTVINISGAVNKCRHQHLFNLKYHDRKPEDLRVQFYHLKYSSSKNWNWSLIVDQLSTSFFVVSFWVCSNQVAAKLTEIIWTGPIRINLRDAPFRLWKKLKFWIFLSTKIFWKPPSSIHILLIFMNEHESWFIMSQYINF